MSDAMAGILFRMHLFGRLQLEANAPMLTNNVNCATMAPDDKNLETIRFLLTSVKNSVIRMLILKARSREILMAFALMLMS